MILIMQTGVFDNTIFSPAAFKFCSIFDPQISTSVSYRLVIKVLEIYSVEGEHDNILKDVEPFERNVVFFNHSVPCKRHIILK